MTFDAPGPLHTHIALHLNNQEATCTSTFDAPGPLHTHITQHLNKQEATCTSTIEKRLNLKDRRNKNYCNPCTELQLKIELDLN